MRIQANIIIIIRLIFDFKTIGVYSKTFLQKKKKKDERK